MFQDAFKTLFDMVKLGVDISEPIDASVLRFNPNSPVTQTVLYLYSMEPPIYRELNMACRKRDYTKIDSLGPFAAAIGEILRTAEQYLSLIHI